MVTVPGNDPPRVSTTIETLNSSAKIARTVSNEIGGVGRAAREQSRDTIRVKDHPRTDWCCPQAAVSGHRPMPNVVSAHSIFCASQRAQSSQCTSAAADTRNSNVISESRKNVANLYTMLGCAVRTIRPTSRRRACKHHIQTCPP